MAVIKNASGEFHPIHLTHFNSFVKLIFPFQIACIGTFEHHKIFMRTPP